MNTPHYSETLRFAQGDVQSPVCYASCQGEACSPLRQTTIKP